MSSLISFLPWILIALVIIGPVTSVFGPKWFIGISFCSSLCLGLLIGIMIKGLKDGASFGLALGLFFAFLFVGGGLLTRFYRQRGENRLREIMGYLDEPPISEESLRPELLPGESLLKASQAKHFRNLDGVGGKIILTNKRLIFKPNPFHYQKYILSIPLENIIKIEPYTVRLLIPKGFKIIVKDGKIERFKVSDAKWIEKIQEAIKLVPAK